MNELRKPASRSTRVDDVIMQSPILPWSEKLLYYSIKSQISQQKGVRNGEFSASKEVLANSVGLSVRTIQRLLRKWRESGYLSVKEANRFKPVKYELREHLLLEHAMRQAGSPGSLEISAPLGQSDVLVRPPVVQVGHTDTLVGHTVAFVGQADTIGKPKSPTIESNSGKTSPDHGQDWRTPERDELVMQMGRKMNEVSTDIMGKFVIDEKWLQFLTREEYNHLIKIFHDIKSKSGE